MMEDVSSRISARMPATSTGWEKYGSPEALQNEGPQRLREAVAALSGKAAPDEVDAYRGFVVTLARRVAEAHKEHGERIGEAEQAALNRIDESLGAQDAGS